MSKLSRVLPLRFFLIIPFVIQIVITVGIIGWLSNRSGHKAVADAASQLLIQSEFRISEHLDLLLGKAQVLTQANAFAHQKGQISLNNSTRLQEHFWQQIQRNTPVVRAIYAGDEKGRYLLIKNNNELEIAIAGERSKYSLDFQGQRQEKLEVDEYDPRKRIWYQKALGSKKSIWTDVYEFASGGDGITSAQAVRTPEGSIAVSAVDVSLEEIGDFLQTINLSPSSAIFVIEKSGLLIASSLNPEKITTNEDSPERVSALNSTSPLVSESAQYVLKNYPNFSSLNNSIRFQAQLPQKKVFLSVVPYKFESFEWFVIAIVPERDLTKLIVENRQRTLLLAGFSLFLAVNVGYLTSKTLTKTISLLIKATKEITDGNWQLPPIEEIDTQEMSELANSFDQMITKMQNVFRDLEGEAYTDILTGFLNQAAFRTYLQANLINTDSHKESFLGVILLDIDDFKLIQTSFGSITASLLLQAIATKLDEALKEVDVAEIKIARMKRDEFAVLLHPISDQSMLISVVDLILSIFKQPFSLGSQDLLVSVSLGVVMNKSNYQSADDVLRDVNLAKLKAKKQGKGNYIIFDDLMHREMKKRLKLEVDLKYAVERQELELWYQPIIMLNPQRIVSFEALLRWRHQEFGLISPVKFIPIAEETGTIIEIGFWVLQTACNQIKQWQQDYPNFAKMRIAVNVSAPQLLAPNFTDQVEEVLKSSGLEGQYLQLEITESVAVSQPNNIISKLQKLKSLDVKICIDDFGTGYSHLNYLLNLPIDILKIDRSFVSEIGNNSKGKEITKTILNLANGIGLETIAEGIETELQLNYLKSLQCPKFQGYLFSPPVSTNDVYQLIISH